jgi:hypothetical protein
MGFLDAERIVACCFSIRRETLTDQAGYCTVTATVRIVAAHWWAGQPCSRVSSTKHSGESQEHDLKKGPMQSLMERLVRRKSGVVYLRVCY